MNVQGMRDIIAALEVKQQLWQRELLIRLWCRLLVDGLGCLWVSLHRSTQSSH
jgi:hypothetical protein